MSQELCPCGSGKTLADCCEPVLKDAAAARTPEELMRARYTAHVLRDYTFLVESTHPGHREGLDEKGIADWAANVTWTGLEVHSATPGMDGSTGEVSFTAHFSVKETPQELREDASFEKLDGRWHYVDGVVHGQEPFVRESPRVGRNEPCPCGSGKKFKKCCGG